MNAKTDEEDLKKVVDHESEFDDSEDNDDDLDEHDRDEGENDDERLVSKQEGDEEGEQSEEEKEREAIRARRREERKHRKEAAKERENTLRRELQARDQIIEQLSHRLSAVEMRGAGNEIAQIDSALNQLAAAYVDAKQQLEKGTNEQDGRIVVEATERMQQIRLRAEQLSNIKNNMAQRVQQPRQTQIDPRLKNYAEEWIKSNDWYDVGGSDEDSRIVSAIDDGLAKEGWNPSSKEYWEELTKRVKKRLPERFEKADNRVRGNGNGKSIVSGSSRSSNSNGGSKQYHLSSERVEAMKEAGLWNDPKKRAATIEAYRKYDKENTK